MSVKFITCIYSDLNGTDLGGRESRYLHYRYSLLSLLKMTDADFVCYTSIREIDSLVDFFYEEHKIDPEKLKFKLFDLNVIKFQELYDKYKDIDHNKKSDRCFAIQYQKFSWWWNEDKSYDYYYWIDSGLSHCGLIPLKYLLDDGTYRKYYESPLYNNNFLKNLTKFSEDKIFVITKENLRNHWCQTVPEKWYNRFDMSLHVISGLFGGKKEQWDNMVNLFEDYLQKITEDSKELYLEEQILSLMYYNHPDMFVEKTFDIWWCPDNGAKDAPPEHYIINKSFYKILEELNE